MHISPLNLGDLDERRALKARDLAPSNYPLNLELAPPPRSSYWGKIIAGSIGVHIVLMLLAVRLPAFQALPHQKPRVTAHVTPLYIPKDVLTQKAPNKREVTKELNVADLMNIQRQQAQQASPNHSVRQFEMPKIASAKPSPKLAATNLPDAPPVAITQTTAPPLPGAVNGLAIAPPPPSPVSGPFQNIGAPEPPPVHPKIAAPKATVQSAISGFTQSGNGSHMIMSDDSPTQGAPPTPGTVGQLGAQHTGVELKSDPQGVDMRPYLAQILTIVRANWRRVIPANVRTGNLRGKTVLEFIINRDGSIPKLVTSESSGLDPLDRAAVTGLSMSNPLPPLPADFKGEQVRLAFSFAYNMASQ